MSSGSDVKLLLWRYLRNDEKTNATVDETYSRFEQIEENYTGLVKYLQVLNPMEDVLLAGPSVSQEKRSSFKL